MFFLLLGKGITTIGAMHLLEHFKLLFEMKEVSEVEPKEYDYIVKSPGISLNDPVFNIVKGKIISDVSLLSMLVHPHLIGVTASNGKTTFVELLYNVLKNKYKVQKCGNIGYSVCDCYLEYPDMDYYIVELSSFMLEAKGPLTLDYAVILNISPCHLDHHKSFASYLDSKLNIVRSLKKGGVCYYNFDDPFLRDVPMLALGDTKGVSINSTACFLYKLGDFFYASNRFMFDLKRISNFYSYQHYMLMIIYDLSRSLGIKGKVILKEFKEFKGVSFRLEEIKPNIYNDAKSTNSSSTACALKVLKENVILICGGFDRGIPIFLDDEALNAISVVVTYGKTASLAYDYFKSHNIRVYSFLTLFDATLKALSLKNDDDIILYSPMFASFDQYKSYVERGKEFNDIIFNNLT